MPDKLFQQAQTLLQRNGHTGGRAVRNKHGALLRGLLRCSPCDCAMSHTYTSKGNRRYRYYGCGTAQQRGWSECPSPSIPAGEIERFVVEQIKRIGRDPAVIAETVRQVRRQTEEGIERLNHERAALQQQLRNDNARLQVAAAMTNDVERVSSLAETQERIRSAERRLTEIDPHRKVLRTLRISCEISRTMKSSSELTDVSLQFRKRKRVPPTDA